MRHHHPHGNRGGEILSYFNMVTLLVSSGATNGMLVLMDLILKFVTLTSVLHCL